MALRAARIAPGLEQPLDRDLPPAAHPEEHLLLLVAAGIADPHLQHEPVELRLGQRVGALVLDRVLRREHEERLLQRVGGAADGDLVLLHRLEQRGLHLGRRAVDLVGEDDLGEERPLLDVEVLGLLVEDHGPDQVGRAAGPGVNWMRENEAWMISARVRTASVLARPGHALEQDVAAGEQPDEEPLHHRVLPDDPARDFLEDRLHRQDLRRLVGQLRHAHARDSVGVMAGKLVGIAEAEARSVRRHLAAPGFTRSGVMPDRLVQAVLFLRRERPVPSRRQIAQPHRAVARAGPAARP